MHDWYLWLTPIAVAAIVFLFAFVGCSSFSGADMPTSYHDDVVADAPVMYLRLQERSPAVVVADGVTAKDEMGAHDGTYQKAGSPLPDLPAQLSPPVPTPLLEGGVGPTLLDTDNSTTSVRVRGARVEVPFAATLNATAFTLEILVEPEWDLTVQGRYYSVFESTDQQTTGSNKSKRRGYALYAGPADPSTPNTPYVWQVWSGNGTDFKRVPQPAATPTNPGPVVEAKPTYLCVTFDGTKFLMWAYTAGRDMDAVKYSLGSRAYTPNVNQMLTVGMTGQNRGLLAPFPGPNRAIYPFIGKLQEVAIYNKALDPGRVGTHIMGAFLG